MIAVFTHWIVRSSAQIFGLRIGMIHLSGVVLCSCIVSACSIIAQESPPSKEKFSACLGVFAFRNAGWEKEGDTVKIYDRNGNIWYAAGFHKEGFDSQGDAGPNKIKPLVLFAGDYRPVFRCVSYSRNWYAVVVVEDEQNPVIKYMLRSDSLFEWQSWHEYYLGKWIRFNSKANPLRDDINSMVVIDFPGEETRTRASKLEGDWMKLEWTTQNGAAQSGWIKWRDEKTNRVLVWFPYA
jgi:hypothetical protein